MSKNWKYISKGNQNWLTYFPHREVVKLRRNAYKKCNLAPSINKIDEKALRIPIRILLILIFIFNFKFKFSFLFRFFLNKKRRTLNIAVIDSFEIYTINPLTNCKQKKIELISLRWKLYLG